MILQSFYNLLASRLRRSLSCEIYQTPGIAVKSVRQNIKFRARQAGRLLRLTCCLLMAGCVSTRLEQVREGQTGLEQGETVVILEYQSYFGYESEVSLADCLAGSTRQLSVIRQDDFADEMFPWFEPKSAPQSLPELEKLLRRPEVSEKIKSIGVRYLVQINGGSDVNEKTGGMSCAIAPGAAFCLGLMLWEQNADYEIAVWDIKRLTRVGRMHSESTSTSAMVGAVVPVPLIASARRSACQVIARRLSDFILNTEG